MKCFSYNFCRLLKSWWLKYCSVSIGQPGERWAVCHCSEWHIKPSWSERMKQSCRNHLRVMREQSCSQWCWDWIWLRVFHGASGEFITGVVPPVTHPFPSSRCCSDHDLQTERAAAAITGRCLGNSAGPEATPNDEDHWWVELQGWLWAPRLLSVYSGPKVKFRAHHDDVKARGERWHCDLAAQRKLVWMPVCLPCEALRRVRMWLLRQDVGTLCFQSVLTWIFFTLTVHILFFSQLRGWTCAAWPTWLRFWTTGGSTSWTRWRDSCRTTTSLSCQITPGTADREGWDYRDLFYIPVSHDGSRRNNQLTS